MSTKKTTHNHRGRRTHNLGLVSLLREPSMGTASDGAVKNVSANVSHVGISDHEIR
jgi:hypothetical protein